MTNDERNNRPVTLVESIIDQQIAINKLIVLLDAHRWDINKYPRLPEYKPNDSPRIHLSNKG